ncbi:LytTR family transcriptional regulator [Sphingomonas sp. ID1715]|nr:LytTR family DNA-binding domain-containing protein [Sphingomonas sp. ID1715]NNM77434.1 LytTR family transcriptional regulator [Sphingomonas sp. ID1715]
MAALIAGNALYCLLYTFLAGRTESVWQAIWWSVVNLAPWLLAFEAGKRSRRPLLAVLGGSVLSLLLAGEFGAFELARRLPGAALTFALLILVRRHEVRTAGGAVALPLPPERIAWVAAAGNYVELHGGDRPLLLRAPLTAVEATLKPHGFVRIHRSTLVNRRRVARVRTADLILDTGHSLKLGPRFRAELTA